MAKFEQYSLTLYFRSQSIGEVSICAISFSFCPADFSVLNDVIRFPLFGAPEKKVVRNSSERRRSNQLIQHEGTVVTGTM